MRRVAKIDNNHKFIVDVLRSHGCSVLSLAAIGKGVPDLLVARGGKLWLLEVKNLKGRGNKLTPDQVEWQSKWKSEVYIVTDYADALAVVSRA